ncbi:hypothetical protein Hdeb2414_s0006g00199601 [Helianthus debilis subsp. tardiflorus]
MHNGFTSLANRTADPLIFSEVAAYAFGSSVSRWFKSSSSLSVSVSVSVSSS